MAPSNDDKSSSSPGRHVPKADPEDHNEAGHRNKRARVEKESKVEQKSNGSQTNTEGKTQIEKTATNNENEPPLPDEQPPLLAEALPSVQAKEPEDDGWAPIWDQSAQAYYFYNRLTGASQWTNPRVPEAAEPISTVPPAPGTESKTKTTSSLEPPPPTSEALPAGGYNPAIHGDYDPNAWYAQTSTTEETQKTGPATNDPTAQYGATAAFNRFTGRFQNSELTPENFNDDNKSKRQMNAFFDVDAAANSHEGKSLKAERSGKKLTKTELKNFKEKKKAKKEEKRRAWLKD